MGLEGVVSGSRARDHEALHVFGWVHGAGSGRRPGSESDRVVGTR